MNKRIIRASMKRIATKTTSLKKPSKKVKLAMSFGDLIKIQEMGKIWKKLPGFIYQQKLKHQGDKRYYAGITKKSYT